MCGGQKGETKKGEEQGEEHVHFCLVGSKLGFQAVSE
jgi:hypothetical protein